MNIKRELFFYILMSTTFAIQVKAADTCDNPNEVYVPCKNPCPETCQSILSGLPQPQCIPPFPCPGGCDCIAGYVRNSSNVCVKKEECYPACAANEVFRNCKTLCPETCDSMATGSHPECISQNTDVCVPGCDCVYGYVRNSKNVCVQKDDCFPECNDPNAVVRDCPTPCPLTCSNLLTNNLICPEICLPRGCTCRPGYAKNAQGKCIPPQFCPPLPCQKNEIWNACPGFCSFETNCGMYIGGYQIMCMPPSPWSVYVCRPRCECAQGYIRKDNNCVKPDECCEDPGAEVLDCPTRCDGNCTNLIPPRRCQQDCLKRRCACKKGFVRGPNDKCIPQSQCYKKCPKPYMEYNDCGSACPPTCANKNPICNKKCVAGCFCKKGLLLNSHGYCVKPYRCC